MFFISKLLPFIKVCFFLLCWHWSLLQDFVNCFLEKFVFEKRINGKLHMKFGKYKQQLWFCLLSTLSTKCSLGRNAFKIPHKQKFSSCVKMERLNGRGQTNSTEPKAPVVCLSNTKMYKSVFTTRVIRALSDPETPLCFVCTHTAPTLCIQCHRGK